MFVKSETSSFPDIFNSFTQNLKGGRLTTFNDKNSWHNVFRENITWQIDESMFNVLFSKEMGRPNSPIRILISMMIMKEGFGWSDAQLFEQCQFNILVMSGLGLSNLNDSIPSPATFYNLRRALYEHQVNTGEDLIGGTFQELTRKQAEIFGVKGTNERMDSVLFGSNIAKSSRLQLVINVLQEFYKDIDKSGIIERLQIEDKKVLEEINKQKSGQIIYQLDAKKREGLIENLGYLLYRLINLYEETDSKKYNLLTRVLNEQYRMEGEEVVLRDIKDLKANSLQSPHDEDANYRNKNGEKAQGYSANITETCNDEGLNLVTDVIVDTATTSDASFVQPGIENSKKIVGEIKNLNTDGAYHSVDNQKYIKGECIEWILSGIQGRKGGFEFGFDGDKKLIAVISVLTGEETIPYQTKSGSYRISINGRYRYFNQKEIESYLQRQQVNNTPQKLKNKRNNVEATVFQLVWPLRNKKSKYRGKHKNQLWAFLRCLWINFIRIKNNIGEVCPGFKKSKSQGALSTFFIGLFTKIEASIKNSALVNDFYLKFYLKINFASF